MRIDLLLHLLRAGLFQGEVGTAEHALEGQGSTSATPAGASLGRAGLYSAQRRFIRA